MRLLHSTNHLKDELTQVQQDNKRLREQVATLTDEARDAAAAVAEVSVAVFGHVRSADVRHCIIVICAARSGRKQASRRTQVGKYARLTVSPLQTEARLLAAEKRADEAHCQMLAMQAAKSGPGAGSRAATRGRDRDAAAEARDAGKVAQEMLDELKSLRALQADFAQHSATVAERDQLKADLTDVQHANRQHAAQLAKRKLELETAQAAGGSDAKRLLKEVTAELERHQAVFKSTAGAAQAYFTMPHSRLVPGRKGAAGKWTLELPAWDAAEGEYALPVLDVLVKRKGSDGTHCGGREFHVLVHLLVCEIAAVFEVAWDRIGDLVALVLRRLRICEVSECAPIPCLLCILGHDNRPYVL